MRPAPSSSPAARMPSSPASIDSHRRGSAAANIRAAAEAVESPASAAGRSPNRYRARRNYRNCCPPPSRRWRWCHLPEEDSRQFRDFAPKRAEPFRRKAVRPSAQRSATDPLPQARFVIGRLQGPVDSALCCCCIPQRRKSARPMSR